MESWRVWELVIDFGVPGLMLAVGLLLVFGVGLRKWRRKPARKCLKCGYDMRGSEGLVCVECGWEGKNQREVEHGRLRRGWVAVGLVLCLPAVWVAGFFAVYSWSGLERRAVDKRLNGIVGSLEVYMNLSQGSEPVAAWSYTGMRREVVERIAGGSNEEPRVFPEAYVPNGEFKRTGLTLDNWDDSRMYRVSQERQEVVYLAHAWLFPVDHYWGYFSNPLDTVVTVRGTGNDVVPSALLEDLRRVENAKGIEWQGVIVDGEVLRVAESLPRFKGGFFSGVTARPEEVARIRQSRFLSLVFARDLTDEDFEVLGGFKNLQYLDLSATGYVGGAFSQKVETLIKSRNWSGLSIGFSEGPEVAASRHSTPEDKAKALERRRNMEELRLDVTTWSDAQVMMLANVSTVRRLDLRNDFQKAPKGAEVLEWIGKAIDIESLRLEGFDGRKLKNKYESPWAVKELTLRYVRVEEDFLKMIEHSRIEELTLSGTGLSNEAMDRFVPGKYLSVLRVAGWRCSEEAVGRLRNCQTLRSVSVDDMPEAALDQLLAAGNVKKVSLWISVLTQELEKVEALRRKYPECKISVGMGRGSRRW